MAFCRKKKFKLVDAAELLQIHDLMTGLLSAAVFKMSLFPSESQVLIICWKKTLKLQIHQFGAVGAD